MFCWYIVVVVTTTFTKVYWVHNNNSFSSSHLILQIPTTQDFRYLLQRLLVIYYFQFTFYYPLHITMMKCWSQWYLCHSYQYIQWSYFLRVCKSRCRKNIKNYWLILISCCVFVSFVFTTNFTQIYIFRNNRIVRQSTRKFLRNMFHRDILW